MRRLARPLFVLVIIAAAAAGVVAQRRWNMSPIDAPIDKAPPYDGKFTFARLKFTTGPGGYYFGGLPAWAHGYIPIRGETIRSEDSLIKILNAVSNVNVHLDGTKVVDVSDPELFEYPVVYATEPGFMELSDKDVVALREYLQKGGFIIFDDFRADGLVNSGGGWANFARNVRRAFPELQPIELDASAAVFHSFFGIDSLAIVPQSYDRGRPAFFGLFEDNDPKKRMMAIVNYNTDVSDFWEFSATGFRPTNESNQAYKLGVNYIMYGMTH
jgi:hypothetical protein